MYQRFLEPYFLIILHILWLSWCNWGCIRESESVCWSYFVMLPCGARADRQADRQTVCVMWKVRSSAVMFLIVWCGVTNSNRFSNVASHKGTHTHTHTEKLSHLSPLTHCEAVESDFRNLVWARVVHTKRLRILKHSVNDWALKPF